jgi:peptidoglycan/xylan/chitin deacetylase (PgdA/CDA1 family)
VFATGFRLPWVILAAAILHACLIYGFAAPWCGWLGPVVRRFQPRGRELWLTLDDGPAGAETVLLGLELQRRGVPATFFIKGRSLAAEPQLAQQLCAAGHTLANHTYTHPVSVFWGLRPAVLRREIDACNEALCRAGVPDRRWFRSPLGLSHILLRRELTVRGMRLIGWSARGRDGLASGPDIVERRVMKGLRPGAIVALHEGRPRSNEIILRVVESIQRLGYTFVIPNEDQLL